MEWDMEPGGPLCGCDTCESIRQEFGVEALSPALIRESGRRQTLTGYWRTPEVA